MAERVLMKGNEAIAEAAIRAGCRHYFGYPITPQTEVAAYMAKRCGFGMVTLHGGHGWLLTQFMHPTNNRKDKWGGSMENRMRFPIAVCDAIRKKCGNNFVIEMRLSGSEVYDGGYDLDYGVEIAKHLDGHLDLIHVSALL